MKIAIVGAGFTGLSAALYLSQNQHQVTVFEKESSLGGLAASFKQPDWLWALEKHYHHWFTNDSYALKLIEQMDLESDLFFPKSLTSVYYHNKQFPLNTPFHVLSFTPLNLTERVRTGMILLYLKLLPPKYAIQLEKFTAYDWLKAKFGQHVFDILWKPLLQGKFGRYAETVNMAWFWARIKKRTSQLGYLKGGYNRLLKSVLKEIKKTGGQILFSTPFDHKLKSRFDKIIITTPSAVFANMFPNLPSDYKNKLKKIIHLHALNLMLISKEKFLDTTYWLNINEKKFPFVGIVQHTNLANSKYYNNQHITWVANYLPADHPYITMSAEELFSIYRPFLQKINPSFNLKLNPSTPLRTGIKNLKLFFGPFAQPVCQINYSKLKPDFITPISNVYLANMDMVYPWDRGTNYAIELGYKVAKLAEIVIGKK